MLTVARKEYAAMTVNVLVDEAPAGYELANTHLIDDQLWSRLVSRIMADEEVDRSLAERIMDQALGFLALCSHEPEKFYSPSPLVDIGWHTFILYTRAYAAFCERMGGFIHHEPTDAPGVVYDSSCISDTVEAMKRRSITVDEALWVGSVSCGVCNNGKCKGGCGGKAS